MRIIAGSLGGRNFDAPNGHKTHPMSDKARGGLFNALGDIQGLSVLDPFAGSGALSFEALSRGGKYATLIESDRNAQATIDKNIKELKLWGKTKAIKAAAGAWSETSQDEMFDLVLCDPPYDKLQLELIQKLVGHVKEHGLLVLSWPGRNELPDFPDLARLKVQDYNDIQLGFYRRES
jgi:16S rRNA (guanine966-N2)-methyltransferase